MSLLTLVKPIIGKPDSTEDVKLVNALTAIEAWANGQIDSTNLKALAEIVGTQLKNGTIEEKQLSAALVKRLGEAVTVGVWKALELGAKVEEAKVGLQTARVRAELGLNTARLRGGLVIKAGQELKEGETLFTLPVGFRPPASVYLMGAVEHGAVRSIRQMAVLPTGEVSLSGAVEENGIVCLDSVTFNLT
jgi:hypothetical protein